MTGTAAAGPSFARRATVWLLAHRLVASLLVAGATVGAGVLAAARVRPDFAVEQYFPQWNEAKADYDRMKADFPYEDALALVIVEADDLFTAAGLERVRALEKDLDSVELGSLVQEVEGLRSIKDVVADGDTIRLERLVPARAERLDPATIAEKRRTATEDPLFRWNLCDPSGRATTIRVTLRTPKPGTPPAEVRPEDNVAGTAEGREAFYAAAEKVLARHERSGQQLTLSGLPIIRADYVRLINRDQRLFGVALAVVLLLLYAAFRSAGEVAAALVTILATVAWTLGAFGALGVPITVLTSISPILVMIISVSDTVHIVTHVNDDRRRGAPRDEAIAGAVASLAGPCLQTEIAIACGFLTLVAVNIVAVVQFGLVTAAGMMLAWLANMTVLPLMLSLLPGRASAAVAGGPAGAETGLARAFGRLLDGIAGAVTGRPRAVALTAVAVLAVAAAAALSLEREYLVFDDLRAGSPLEKRIRDAETVPGGLVPLVVYVEGTGDEAMHEPEAIRTIARCEKRLREVWKGIVERHELKVPEELPVTSVAGYIRKGHRLIHGGGDEAGHGHGHGHGDADGDLPQTRAAVREALDSMDDRAAGRRGTLGDYLSPERRRAAVVARLPDVGSSRVRELMADMRAFLAEETKRVAPLSLKLTLTGQMALADEVFVMLLDSLFKSFGLAIALSFAVFSAVLRTWRLGLIALIPNLVPMALTFGFMGFAGIALKPSTVIIFSVALTIADDDTIQYLARFRSRFHAAQGAALPDPHRDAALGTLRETGLPMFVTSCAVSAGFLTLVLSEFVGLAELGVLIGVTLFCAVFADLFLSPLVIMAVRPRIATGGLSCAQCPVPSAQAPGPPPGGLQPAERAAAREGARGGECPVPSEPTDPLRPAPPTP